MRISRENIQNSPQKLIFQQGKFGNIQMSIRRLSVAMQHMDRFHQKGTNPHFRKN